jgi:fermentation-respiration switch protein FrsA (DUF1100 family)
MAQVAGVVATMSVAGAGFASAQETPPEMGAAGHWAGTLSVPGAELRLVFHIERDEDSVLSGTLDSPDQGAYGLRLSTVTEEAGAVVFAIASLGGRYTGQLSADSRTIDGQWAQGGGSFPLDLERGDASALALKRPQEPQPPYPYEVMDVGFENPQAGIRLAGTLTVPPGDGPHPSVALISGSGPQDRDESVFGHRPFFVLADYLTRRGIAVLRYDDRGIGESSGDFSIATTPDFAGDALAAVAWLKSHPRVDPGRIGLVGHSEGAMVAPMVANLSGDVAFVVLLAGTGVNGRDLLVMQAKAINRASGLSEALVEQNSALQQQILDVVVTAGNDTEAAEQARAILAQAGLTGPPADAQVRALLSPWMKYFLVYDPLPALRELSIPVLALNGEKDTQVPPTENLLPTAEALQEGGNPDVTAEVLPGLNHLFQTAATGAPSEYAGIEETFSPEALAKIADWIAERTGPLSPVCPSCGP